MTGTLRQYLRWAVASAVALAALAGAASAMATSPAASVYTQTNDPAGNRVQVLEPSQGGALTRTRSFPTGGQGSGAGLGSQGAADATFSGGRHDVRASPGRLHRWR